MQYITYLIIDTYKQTYMHTQMHMYSYNKNKNKNNISKMAQQQILKVMNKQQDEEQEEK